ncbi:glycosyltransferase family 2 protein [Vibrio sp. JC009]|uniref:glycosyltransferase family 2 protein n=1 Tax=Vibrio sp. JC009 TaxID=2912314 RepID=UPI0023AF26A7|nr:glycosyltransferase family 2 protein [Vibrio sp. JC009]WED22005.1 glycosyltransferase family 2 protein [Vibrio sp. JC009]
MSNIEKDLVSVGIPTYNRPEELSSAIELILNQTYENIEVIVSDNKSERSEEVKKIVSKFQSSDNRIRFFQQETNIGSIGNFKFVLGKATADYFMWAADDDELEPNYIEALMDKLTSEKGSIFVVSGYDVVDRMKEPVIKTDFTQYLFDIPGGTPFERMSNYVRQPDYQGKSKILWGIHRISTLREAFDEVFVGLPERSNITWAELPVEFRLLAKGNLSIVPDVLFHANLLPSSEGLREGELFNKREVEICRRSYDAYRRAVESSIQLSPKERATLFRMLKKEELIVISRMVAFGAIKRLSPNLARNIKKIWMMLLK